MRDPLMELFQKRLDSFRSAQAGIKAVVPSDSATFNRAHDDLDNTAYVLALSMSVMASTGMIEGLE